MKKTFFGLLTALLALNGVSAYAHGDCGSKATKKGSSDRVAKEACAHKGGKGGCGCGKAIEKSPAQKIDSKAASAK